MHKVGPVIWIDNKSLIDVITYILGLGQAYFS